MIHLTSTQYEALRLKAMQRDDLLKVLDRIAAYPQTTGDERSAQGLRQMARAAADLAISEAA
jgi:phage protein U